jgi:hypothetical protein
MTSLTDVTEPKRIRTELAAAHDRFVRVLESLEAAVSVVSSDAGRTGRPTLLFGNRAYAESFGPGAVGHDRLQQALRRPRQRRGARRRDRPLVRRAHARDPLAGARRWLQR